MADFFAPPETPQTALAKPRILSPLAGVKVSPLVLVSGSLYEGNH
jgi:hypothetical protein